jgi:hypothetical protein
MALRRAWHRSDPNRGRSRKPSPSSPPVDAWLQVALAAWDPARPVSRARYYGANRSYDCCLCVARGCSELGDGTPSARAATLRGRRRALASALLRRPTEKPTRTDQPRSGAPPPVLAGAFCCSQDGQARHRFTAELAVGRRAGCADDDARTGLVGGQKDLGTSRTSPSHRRSARGR